MRQACMQQGASPSTDSWHCLLFVFGEAIIELNLHVVHLCCSQNFKMNVKKLSVIVVIILVAFMGAKRKVDNRNESRKLKRRAEALMKKRISEAKKKLQVLDAQRARRANNRLAHFRSSIKKR